MTDHERQAKSCYAMALLAQKRKGILMLFSPATRDIHKPIGSKLEW